MPDRYDLAVIGGGPAGTAAAITAARLGRRVLLLERGGYPRQKVCGEFVSAESLALLKDLLSGLPEEDVLSNAPRVADARLFLGNTCVDGRIEPAAASISRHVLDAALWRAAEAAGVHAMQSCTGRRVQRNCGVFRITTDDFDCASAAVIDATGRWSNLRRAHSATPGAIGVKAHFAAARALDSVDLYLSDSGYCGVQPISHPPPANMHGAPHIVNVCALLPPEALRERAPIEAALAVHPRLWRESREWLQYTDTVTTAPLVFVVPLPVSDGLLCVGDAAGFIDPFLGDGISLALQTGVLAAQLAHDPHAYEREYHRRFLPLFRRAARLRQLLAAPRILRGVAVRAVQFAGLGSLLVRVTRAGG